VQVDRATIETGNRYSVTELAQHQQRTAVRPMRISDAGSVIHVVLEIRTSTLLFPKKSLVAGFLGTEVQTL